MDRLDRVRDRLRLSVVSRWVWVLLALAVMWVVLAQLSASRTTISVGNLYSAFLAATPAIFAAALMYVAPQDRLIRVAAFCFAFPIAVNLIIGAGILMFAQSLSPDYAYLVPRLVSVGDAFRVVAWAFPIVAVFMLAAYVGPVVTRSSWLIIGGATVAAVLNVAVIVASQPEGVPLEQTFIAVLARSVWIAWAYLLAVAIEHRMFLVALASGAYLLSALVNLVTFTFLLGEFDDPGAPQAQAIVAALWLLGVISWAALIAGILRELPRPETVLPARRGTHEALSPTR